MSQHDSLGELMDITAGIPKDRLKELCEAEKDGRCVVLPCKVGDTVYVLVGNCTRIKTDKIKAIYQDSENWWVEFTYIWHDTDFSDFGKTVFLSKEAAENALKECDSNG